jgi:hypothetical protein
MDGEEWTGLAGGRYLVTAVLQDCVDVSGAANDSARAHHARSSKPFSITKGALTRSGAQPR